MKASELREKSTAELNTLYDEYCEDYYRMKHNPRTRGTENPGRIQNIRKDIARILTIIRQREPASQSD